MVLWRPYLTFPGVRPGEALTRKTELPPRAPLLARDGSVLSEGPATEPASKATAETARTSPLGAGAEAVVGGVGPIPAAERAALESQGVPASALVGVSGLEKILDARLRGTPGGTLYAGSRVLATAEPHAAAPVRTSISPQVQSAAVEALGGVYGGIVALDPRNGQVLGVSGIGLEGLQPPGSTFKIITASAALEQGVTSLTTSYPAESYATLDGVKLENAHGEVCGGTLIESFAKSCNSVFAPLGVKVGATALVAMAEKFGFNHSPELPGAAESTIPAAGKIQGELALGSTAIGQGEVQATPLAMGIAAATIGERGKRPRPTFTLSDQPPAAAAVTPRVASEMRTMMIAVVTGGTGTAAAIPGVVVAGKTGTAEIGEPCKTSEGGAETPSCKEPASASTDAWFAAFAPAARPRVAIGVLLVKDGFGGETAAPAARQVMEAALSAGL